MLESVAKVLGRVAKVSGRVPSVLGRVPRVLGSGAKVLGRVPKMLEIFFGLVLHCRIIIGTRSKKFNFFWVKCFKISNEIWKTNQKMFC